MFKKYLTCLLGFLLYSSSLYAQSPAVTNATQQHPQSLNWSNLIPADFNPQNLIKRFEKDLLRLDELPDNSEEGLEIIERIQAAVDAIPSNKELHDKWIKLPGFIAPITIVEGKVTRFLLVPYFGACIHVPPPPVNQTVLVDMLPDQGIDVDDVYYSFMVTGNMQVYKTDTDIGNAGYHITQASIKVHHDTLWLEPEGEQNGESQIEPEQRP